MSESHLLDGDIEKAKNVYAFTQKHFDCCGRGYRLAMECEKMQAVVEAAKAYADCPIGNDAIPAYHNLIRAVKALYPKPDPIEELAKDFFDVDWNEPGEQETRTKRLAAFLKQRGVTVGK